MLLYPCETLKLYSFFQNYLSEPKASLANSSTLRLTSAYFWTYPCCSKTSVSSAHLSSTFRFRWCSKISLFGCLLRMSGFPSSVLYTTLSFVFRTIAQFLSTCPLVPEPLGVVNPIPLYITLYAFPNLRNSPKNFRNFLNLLLTRRFVEIKILIPRLGIDATTFLHY